MSGPIIGDGTVYTVESGVREGRQEAFQFTAEATDTLATLRFRVSDTVACTCTSVLLGIYSDSADEPDALLGYATYTGTPGLGDWIAALGLSVPITDTVKYWLAALPLGGELNYPVAVDSGGSADWISDSFAFTAFEATWPTTSAFRKFDDGPVGFEGLSGVTLRFGSGLVWQVSGLWYPEAETVDYYGQVADPQSDSVTIPLDDSRLGEITVSVWDPIVTSLVGHAYGRLLKAYYHGVLVLWGVYKLGNIDAAAGTATLNVVDPSIRVIRHYLRRGDIDGDLSAPNDDKATVTIDGDGMRLLLDAARSIPAQTALGEPDIGIDPGTDSSTPAPDALMGVSRGDEVWATMVSLSQALGPDFELAPTEDIVGAYCELRTYDRQGIDKSALVKLHYATGLDNLDNLAFSEGSEYTTHDHVLSRDGRRVTSIAPAYLVTGQYTTWSATDFDAANIDPDKADAVLAAYGEAFLKAYGRPLLVLTATMPVETEDGFLYLRDYEVGDTIEVAGKIGLIVLEEAPYRITQVILRRVEGGIQPELQIVADRVAAAGDSIGGDIT